MMAYGQPLHCFDADMIQGGEIVVRTLENGTKFVTLDGEEHELSDRDLAICNAKEACALLVSSGARVVERMKQLPMSCLKVLTSIPLG